MVFAAQICMLLFTTGLLCMYIRDKSVHTASNYIFKNILISVTAFVAFDTVVSILLQTNLFDHVLSDQIAQTIVVLADKMRSGLVVCMMVHVFEYCVFNAFLHFKINLWIKVIITILPLFLPATINSQARVITGYHLIYMFAMIVLGIVFLLFFAIKNFQNIDKTRFVCSMIWLGLFVLGEVYNIFFGENFIATFSCPISIMLMFYYVENPKAFVDNSTGFFNVYFMKEYVDSFSRWNRQVYVGTIYSKIRYFNIDLLKALVNDRIYCFKDTDSYIYVVSEDKDALMNLLKTYRDSEESLIMLYTHSSDVVVDSFVAYVKQYSHSLSDRVLHILSADDIKRLEDDEKIRMEIVHALVEDRILTYIQPIYDVKQGRFTSGECLCRLKRSNGEILSPYAFIPVAERTGLITSIESVMFRNLCKCLSDERLKLSNIQYLDINLSIKKGERHDLVDEYISVLNEYSLDANKINLEITETDIVEEKMSILNNMEIMREYGFRFSLDDFGTGESNLGYIIDMPVSAIKFDKELTQKALSDDKARIILSSVIQMAHGLNLSVVMEGIEDEECFNMCKALDADYVQGYYFAKPLPIDEFMMIID